MHTTAYRFGRFELRADERHLLLDGAPLKLGGRAFDLLLALAEHGGDLVPRQVLFDRVWPGRVVEDQNLKVQVTALRKLLGPHAIGTVPGRGYRLAAALTDGGTGVAAPRRHAAPDAAPPADPAILIGRAKDLTALGPLVDGQRLVTVTGPGGIGKTRLALAVAAAQRQRDGDGVWIAELASLADAGGLCTSVAQAVGVAPTVARGSPEGLARSLSGLSGLLVLDNCEHLLDSVSRLAEALLRQVPQLRLLVTSQEPLRLGAENVYRLGPLAVPERSDEPHAGDYGAVALFAARARAASAGFALGDDNRAAVIEICERLDGLALAIELAAARVPLLGVEGVRERLGERLRLLVGGARTAPDRQRTLRGALEWSCALLSDAERVLLRRLGIFAGSFALDTAQAVVADAAMDRWDVLDHLGALVDKSLVQADAGDAPRYRLLESTRAFAVEQLAAAGETDALRRRHAQAMLQTFERADAVYIGVAALPWVAQHLPDLDNLREALGWARSAADAPDAAAREIAVGLAGHCMTFWFQANLLGEAATAIEAVRPWVDGSISAPRAARYWLAVAQLGGYWASAPGPAVEAAGKAHALYRGLGDTLGVYRTLYLLIPLSVRSGTEGELPALVDEMRRCEQPTWSPLMGKLLRLTLADEHKRQGRLADYRDALREEVHLMVLHGDVRNAWLASHALATAQLALGNAEAAVELMQSVVTQARSLGLLRQCWAQMAMLMLALIECGDLARAMPTLRETLALLRAEGTVWWAADHLALVPALRGDLANAARLHGWSDAQLAGRGEARRGPAMQAAYDRLRQRLNSGLGAAQADALAAQGARLDDDAVIATVLGETQNVPA
ncbi:MAG: winged helix-turn-helix domain-containing protein [Pseudomonadota bacterium]